MIWLQQMTAQAVEAFRTVRDREEGQGMVEYALILALVSIAALVILPTLGADVTQVFTDVANAL